MEFVKLIKVIDWNQIGIRTEGRPKNGWRDRVIHDLKTRKLRNLKQLFHPYPANVEYRVS
jgi:hypothetical protein